jgi:hypothetical protein
VRNAKAVLLLAHRVILRRQANSVANEAKRKKGLAQPLLALSDIGGTSTGMDAPATAATKEIAR